MSISAPDLTPSGPPMAPVEALPQYDQLVTEDDTPVDGFYSEKLMRLLTESLFSSWKGPGPGRNFLVLANVGLFYSVRVPAVVPDVFLSLDVDPPSDPLPKENRSYFIWRYGKPPEIAIEIVSNTEGGEDTKKMEIYARIGIAYYVIWDPENLLKGGRLRVFELTAGTYQPKGDLWFPRLNLGLRIWHGEFEKITADWLRWYDDQGNMILTGRERAEQADQRAEQADRRAEQALRRAERLAEKMRKLGLDPDANGDQ